MLFHYPPCLVNGKPASTIAYVFYFEARLKSDNPSFVAPDELIREPLTALFDLRLTDQEIAKALKDYYDQSQFGLRCARFSCLIFAL
jgi:hypothetical protein